VLLMTLISRPYSDTFQCLQNAYLLLLPQNLFSESQPINCTPDNHKYATFVSVDDWSYWSVIVQSKIDAPCCCRSCWTYPPCSLRAQKLISMLVTPVISMAYKERRNQSQSFCFVQLVLSNSLSMYNGDTRI